LKPTVSAKDIGLLEEHAELPSAEEVLGRFNAFRDACSRKVEMPSKASEPPALPIPEAPAIEDDEVEVLSEDASPTLEEEGPTLAADEDAEAESEHAEAPLAPDEAEEEEASPDTLEEVSAEEASAQAGEEISDVDSDADTLMAMPALPSEEQDGGTLTMTGLSDEAVAQARGEEAEPDVDAQEAQTLVAPALEVEATETIEAPAPKRKGRKSRKAKKKS